MRTKTQIIVPGATTANDDISIDGGDFEDLINVDTCLLTEAAPNTIGVTAETIDAKGTAAPAAGHCALQDKSTIRMGDDTITSTFLIVVGITEDSVLKLD